MALLACHPLQIGHLGTVVNDDNEDVCIHLNGVSMPMPTPVEKISNALLDDGGWERVSTVHFYIAPADCANLPDRPTYEVEYEIHSNGQNPCPNGNPCTEGGTNYNVFINHRHYWKVTIHLTKAQLLDEIHDGRFLVSNKHIINHEMGHALGLADPTPSSEAQGVDHCYIYNIAIESIMHDTTYGCDGKMAPNSDYPSTNDIDMVELIDDQYQ